MTKRKEKELRREDIIFSLAKHAHQDWFHSLLSWKTENLKKLLEFYEGKREIVLKEKTYPSFRGREYAFIVCEEARGYLIGQLIA